MIRAVAQAPGVDRSARIHAAAPTVLGLVAGLAVLALAIVAAGRPAAFVDLPSILIVLLGTLAVAASSFQLEDLARAPATLLRALRQAGVNPYGAADRLVSLAELARRDGLLALERRTHTLSDRPILRRGVMLAVDGSEESTIERALDRDLDALLTRHHRAAGMVRRGADVAPAMGLIGTLVGLVQMLGRLDDPSQIGPAMAVALLTTFYGAVLSHMVLTPLAVKLERLSASEALVCDMEIIAVCSIRRGENPRHLRSAIDGMLPMGRMRDERAARGSHVAAGRAANT